MVAALNNILFRKLAVAIDLPELADDPNYASNAQRVKHRDTLNARLLERFATRSTAEWVKRLTDAGVPCSRINTVEDVLLDPQTAAREMIMDLEHPTLGTIKVPGIPIKMSDTPGSGRRAPPLLGQHQHEVLAELGLAPDEIEALRTNGAG
jgi:crotonobetainyl-CoA:carnitine CoA-transferase CaiB-like acyl-CoA transferase